MGGLVSTKMSHDTCGAKIDDIKLTENWEKYTIGLKGKELK